MPAFVRTDKDEARWADAKKEATEEGKANNYAYITAIYNRMKKGYDTSPMPQVAGLGTPFNHGEVPKLTVTRKPSIAPDLDPERMPEPKSPQEMMLPLGPFHTAKDAVHGMGLPPYSERSWASAFENAANQSDSELRFKQSLMSKLLENFADDASVRKEMYQRALTYYRGIDKPQDATLTLKAKSKAARTMTRESRETRGGHKLPLHGRKDPIQEVMQTQRTLPAGTIRVHFSSERKGYVRAMKRADGTWKVLGDVKKQPKKDTDHTKPKLVVHHDEHHRGGHEPHHQAEDEHDSARSHVLTMKAKTENNQSKEIEMSDMNDIYKAIMDREVGDVAVMRPNDAQSEFTGMPEEALSEAKTEAINPAATAAGAEEGNPETESPLTPAAGSGDADGLGGATDDNGEMQTSKGAETNAWGTVAKGSEHPNHMEKLNITEQASGTWNQGADSRVTYSSNEDEFIAAAMQKSDNLCIAPEPSVRYAVSMGAQISTCGHQFAKALTVCPSCGTSTAGATGQVQGLSISKSVQSRLSAPVQLPDIRLAD